MSRGLKVRICKTCGEEFSSYNPNPKYCSLKCKAEDYKHEVPIDRMIQLYESGLTQEEVAKELGTTQKVIWKRMKEIGYKARVAAKRNQRKENNDYWRGGRTRHSNGYVYVKQKGHPRALKAGDYVLEHILVAEKVIGRYLRPDEIVHHINGIKDDNRPENLYITNLAEHTRMHNDGVSHLVTSNLDNYKTEEII